MTDEQVEQVAREWCRLAGLDADNVVSHSPDPDPVTGFMYDICLYSPRWRRVARDVRARVRMDEAFRVLDGTPEVS